jgi:hypothetical protein
MRLLRVSAWSALRLLLPLRTEPASVKPFLFLSRLVIREVQFPSAAGTMFPYGRFQFRGGLSVVATPPDSTRITPVWSVKKYRRPVVPGVTGLAVMV